MERGNEGKREGGKVRKRKRGKEGKEGKEGNGEKEQI